MSGRRSKHTPTPTASASGDGVRLSQGGEGLESVEGSRGDGGQLVVIQRQQADIVQAGETVVMDAADLVVPQHPKDETRLQVKHSGLWGGAGRRLRLDVTHSIRRPSSPRNIPLRTESI